MANCCEDKACEISALKERHARVLWCVLTINALMFLLCRYRGDNLNMRSTWLCSRNDVIANATGN
jgi:hypothetical protein